MFPVGADRQREYEPKTVDAFYTVPLELQECESAGRRVPAEDHDRTVVRTYGVEAASVWANSQFAGAVEPAYSSHTVFLDLHECEGASR